MKYRNAEEYLADIEQMIEIDHPGVYGLHVNADIIYQTNMTETVLDTIISVQPKGIY